jgi:alpha-L-rhamnosidase
VLGKDDDARTYRDLFARIKAAFTREYVTSTGRLTSNTQTAYVLALVFGLLPDSLRAEAARRLAADVRTMGHLTTGFLGTPALARVLSDNGYLDVAYALLLNEAYPSWLYPVKQGATTIWERWDGQRPDGSFQDAGMNSFNHYAYGAIGDWMYSVVAGLDMDASEPAYRHARIQPRPGGRFTSARASLRTMYGEVASAWTLKGDRFNLTVRVPPNTRATVRLPAAQVLQVTESGLPLPSVVGVARAAQDGDDVEVEIWSGDYTFAYDAPALAARVRGAQPGAGR